MKRLKRFERSVLYASLLAASVALLSLSRAHHELSESHVALSERLQWPHPGSVVPTFVGRTSEGEQLVVGRAPPGARQLLFVLGTECPYSRRSLPAWRAIGEASREVPGLQVLAAATDEEPEKVASYAEVHGLTFPVVTFPERKLVRLYRARSVPLVLLLDEAGTVLYSRPGVLEREAARDSVLAAASRPAEARAALVAGS